MTGNETQVRSGPIVVGVDTSSGADAALGWAVRTARETGATIVAVHTVAPYLFLQGHPLFAAFPSEELWGEWRDEVTRTAKEWCAVRIPGDVEWVAETIEGDASTLLDRAAALDARMVVVGRRGRNTVTEFFLGSYSHRVVHLADRPVVIVPPV